MADDSRYSSVADTSGTGMNKRKYDDQTPPSPRRPTGFSSQELAYAPPSFNSIPTPAEEIQIAKQRAQEIAARLLSGASAGATTADIKRPRLDNGTSGFDSLDNDVKLNSTPSAIPVSYGSYLGGPSKKIDIPNGRVGVIIGKGGETIKYLQNQSGAKIQITRDMDADLNAPTRSVELMGTPEQIAKAERLIYDVLSEAEVGGSATVSRRFGGQGGSGHFNVKIANNKVGLVIGKGGETIKNIQARTGARVQVIPLHLPPGDSSTERTVHIEGSNEQIEAAKQLVTEVTSENRGRNPALSGGYSQQGYQARHPSNWGPHDAPPVQQPGYGYMQPGAYPGHSPHYNMSQPPYSGYSQPTSSAYSSNWDQSSVSANQQKSQGYEYYSQPPSQQQSAASGPAALSDNTGYNYGQPPASAYSQQGQSYAQGGYGGYYQSAYGPQYDQQQGYNSASSYGNMSNAGQEGQTPTSYGGQGDSTQGPPLPSTMGQRGYGTRQQPSPKMGNYSSAPATQPGYGMPPTSQGAYGNQLQAQPGYGLPPQPQKLPANIYGQAQQSPTTPGGYGQTASIQPGYSHSQPPQYGYSQPYSDSQQTPPSSYGAAGAAAQPSYGPPYGAPQVGQTVHGGQGPPPYNMSYGSGYLQPASYPSDGNSGVNGTRGAYDAVPAPQSAQQTVAKASPKS